MGWHAKLLSPLSHFAGLFADSDPGLPLLQYQSFWFCHGGGRAAANTQWTRTRWRQPPGCQGTSERRKRSEWMKAAERWSRSTINITETSSHSFTQSITLSRAGEGTSTRSSGGWCTDSILFLFLSAVYSQCARCPPLPALGEVCEHTGVPQGSSQLDRAPRCHVIQPFLANGQCTVQQHRSCSVKKQFSQNFKTCLLLSKLKKKFQMGW